MNSVNANWMSESFQPVPACSGLTNSVQEYCRLAIMTIAMSAAMGWNHRLWRFNALPPEGAREDDVAVLVEHLRVDATIWLSRTESATKAIDGRCLRPSKCSGVPT